MTEIAVFLTFVITSLTWALLWALVTIGNKKGDQNAKDSCNCVHHPELRAVQPN